ncbi:hypothetical protein AK812_SmicGene37331 [Symbiodinium microadriaticum]|uniref:Uncharacterized protein n=1 Tax=Symbiodinium microadriaticum TaxID=2951 RepID=A0A1Q9CGJ2_SYMMI|nr:hypothetical protein AK812_SmicGene37331 [Symbiodinium microadriaticum]CAE7689881.1 unnamed protein product [Symbiodinium microadriaticum]CAE7867747.1 unnamed protein product [Symbiodinium sp. KB8]
MGCGSSQSTTPVLQDSVDEPVVILPGTLLYVSSAHPATVLRRFSLAPARAELPGAVEDDLPISSAGVIVAVDELPDVMQAPARESENAGTASGMASQPAKLEVMPAREFTSRPKAMPCKPKPLQSLPEFAPAADSMSPSRPGAWPEATSSIHPQMDPGDVPVENDCAATGCLEAACIRKSAAAAPVTRWVKSANRQRQLQPTRESSKAGGFSKEAGEDEAVEDFEDHGDAAAARLQDLLFAKWEAESLVCRVASKEIRSQRTSNSSSTRETTLFAAPLRPPRRGRCGHGAWSFGARGRGGHVTLKARACLVPPGSDAGQCIEPAPLPVLQTDSVVLLAGQREAAEVLTPGSEPGDVQDVRSDDSSMEHRGDVLDSFLRGVFSPLLP